MLKATEYKAIDSIELPDDDLEELLNECTMWGRLLFSQNCDAFRKYMVRQEFLTGLPSHRSLLCFDFIPLPNVRNCRGCRQNSANAQSTCA